MDVERLSASLARYYAAAEAFEQCAKSAQGRLEELGMYTVSAELPAIRIITRQVEDRVVQGLAEDQQRSIMSRAREIARTATAKMVEEKGDQLGFCKSMESTIRDAIRSRNKTFEEIDNSKK